MKELIIKYIERNFRFILTGLTSLFIFDLSTGKRLKPGELMSELTEIFGNIDYNETLSIVEPWFNGEITRIQNKIVDLQYDMYAELNKIPSLRITEACEPLSYTNLSAYLPTIDWLMNLPDEERIQCLAEIFDSPDIEE